MSFHRRAIRVTRSSIIALIAIACAATGAGAQTAYLFMPVFVQQSGPKGVQVEVAAGPLGPFE